MLVADSLVFLIIFFGNAILLVIFYGDSLLIIIGVLIAKGVFNCTVTLGILTVTAGLGDWISCLPGKFL